MTPYPSKSPVDPLSDKVVKQCLEKGMPDALDSTCPRILKADTPFFNDRKRDVAELQEMLRRGDDKWAVPRGDYQYLWNLIKVV